MSRRKRRSLQNGLQKALKAVKSLLDDESGQATTEYALLLLVLSGIMFTLGKAFMNKIKQLTDSLVQNNLGARIFNPGAMHRFRL